MSETDKKPPITIYYNVPRGPIRGPGVVANNLSLGLVEAGIDTLVYSHVTPESLADKSRLLGCLQPVPGMDLLPRDTLMGPNLFVLPKEFPIVSRFDHYLVPSTWVQDKYRSFSELSHTTLDIWSVGVNTTDWKPNPTVEKSLDCFVYFKNRSATDLAVVKLLLKRLGLKHAVLRYGEYQESDLKHLCQISKFAVLVTGTESQGLGYMQILSMGVPCYVLDKWFWNYEGQIETKYPGTSVPYFVPGVCGELSRIIDKEHLEKFIQSVKEGKYNPRQYILDNHTLKASAERYYDLLLRYQEGISK
jgi:hypothetical protein